MATMRAPTTPVICSTCGKELPGTECAEGFRVRRHLNSITESFCPGAHTVAHQPVVVFRRECRDTLRHALEIAEAAP